MIFDPPLQSAVLIKRYKRFLADVQLSDGTTLTIHCPNTGSMLHCAEPGSRAWYSTSASKGRKYPNTWEIVENAQGARIGINTGIANKLVEEAVLAGRIESLAAYQTIRREVPYGVEGSRVDFLLSDSSIHGQPDCYVEVKNVTLLCKQGLGAFPDSVSTRAHKHLRELIDVTRQGQRALLIYCVQHEGIERVVPAEWIDPKYAQLLTRAKEAGVEVIALGARFKRNEIVLETSISVGPE
jgi:sugar fermentation stimulation protein A